jgi:hypothetical protein
MKYAYKRKQIYSLNGIIIKVRVDKTDKLVGIDQFIRTKDYRKEYRQAFKKLKINGCAICGYSKCLSSLD